MCNDCNYLTSCAHVSIQTCPHLLLLLRCAAQQHVEQNMRQKVDCDFVVMFDNETAAGEHFACQLMSHLKRTKPAPKTADFKDKLMRS